MPHVSLSHRWVCSLLLTTILLSPLPLQAQESRATNDRLKALEDQLEVMREYRMRDEDRPAPVKTNVPLAGSARFELAISEMEEEVRFLRGQMEAIEFEQKRLQDEWGRFEMDVDARLAALEAGGGAANSSMVRIPGAADAPTDEPTPEALENEPVAEEEPAEEAASDSPYDNARDHYDAAFKELNLGNYDQSAALFEDFIKRHKDDNYVGNAYYWLGETHYVRRQYSDAADAFRAGFEAMPDGPKAPDNLLKLGMSLSALDRKKEACVVLAQLNKKYADKSQVIKRKSAKESAKLKCE